MSLNGYSWVEGRVADGRDPSGTCPTNPWWNDIPGQRCVWLANELSRQYNIPLDVLMQKDVFELEYIYALGNLNNTLSNAAILPTLFYQNPGVAWQALQQFVSGCAPVSLAGVMAAPNAGGVGMVVLGAGIVIGLLLLGAATAGTLNRPMVSTFPQAQAVPTAQVIPDVRPQVTPTQENDEFVGFHGSAEGLRDSLLSGEFSDDLAGSTTGVNPSSLQLGPGLYVVKAASLTDPDAIAMANYFAIVASQENGSNGLILRVFARGFSQMRRLILPSGVALPADALTAFDYIESPIVRFGDFTQIKFNPHVFGRLRFR
jgi:hypothetical protein